MPAKAAPPSSQVAIPNVKKMKTTELVDCLGVTKAHIADLETVEDLLQSEIIVRANGSSHVDGVVFGATIVAEMTTSKLDTDKIKEEMGEKWCRRFMKWGIRKSYVLIKARKAQLAA